MDPIEISRTAAGQMPLHEEQTPPHVEQTPPYEGETPLHEDMIAFAAEPIPTVRVGFIGLGIRGSSAVERYAHLDGVRIVALADVMHENIEAAQQTLRRHGLAEAAGYWGKEMSWQALCRRDDVDLVYIATDWEHHVPMALYAMEQGKHVAVEVPAAMTMEEIWALVDTAERTRRHCIQLENCIYDRFELNTLNMAQAGLFGEILHVEGAYIHPMTDDWREGRRLWRLDYNRRHRGDIYATHSMGAICQLLNIHRGDRLKTLVAMDTPAVTGYEVSLEATGERPEYFANGDHTMTMIRTLRGKTIHIQHDVMNPRPYSRMYQLTGTLGFANKYPTEGYAFAPEGKEFLSPEEQARLVEEYTHPILRETGARAEAVCGSRAMNFVMDYRLVYCLRHGLQLDMDVYDLAEWCCLAPLTARSLEAGSAPVEIPDFTRGRWQKLCAYRHAYAHEP